MPSDRMSDGRLATFEKYAVAECSSECGTCSAMPICESTYRDREPELLAALRAERTAYDELLAAAEVFDSKFELARENQWEFPDWLVAALDALRAIIERNQHE